MSSSGACHIVPTMQLRYLCYPCKVWRQAGSDTSAGERGKSHAFMCRVLLHVCAWRLIAVPLRAVGSTDGSQRQRRRLRSRSPAGWERVTEWRRMRGGSGGGSMFIHVSSHLQPLGAARGLLTGWIGCSTLSIMPVFMDVDFKKLQSRWQVYLLNT